MRLANTMRVLWHMLASGHGQLLADELVRRLWSTRLSFGFQMPLNEMPPAPPPQVPVHLRELQKTDIPILLNPDDATTHAGAKDRFIRMIMVNSGLKTCYVAATEDDRPCHMQWLITSRSNPDIKALSAGGLPPLADDEVLLENVFTLESYRRKGIEAWVVNELFRKALEGGARRAIVFVQASNTVSLTMMKRLGFSPFLRKEDRRRFFLPRFHFERLPDGCPHPVDQL